MRVQRFILGKWQFSRAQFVVGDRQRVLIGVIAGLVLEQLRRRVSLGAGAGGGRHADIGRDRPRQAIVADLHFIADDQQVARFDVAVLNGDRLPCGADRVHGLIEKVDRSCGAGDVVQELVERNSFKSGLFRFTEPLREALIAEAHGDDQFIRLAAQRSLFV